MLKGLCHSLSSSLFCLTVPKNAVGESFSHSLISDIEEVPIAIKFMDKKGGGSVKIFRRKFFVSQC